MKEKSRTGESVPLSLVLLILSFCFSSLKLLQKSISSLVFFSIHHLKAPSLSSSSSFPSALFLFPNFFSILPFASQLLFFLFFFFTSIFLSLFLSFLSWASFLPSQRKMVPEETSPESKRGCFIVFEGIDRSGKSTQSRLIYERLLKEGYSVELWRFPDRSTRIGKVLNSYLLDETEEGEETEKEGGKSIPSSSSSGVYPPQMFHLLFAANRWECQEKLLKALNEGKIVVADRYSYSGIAYSCGAAPVIYEARKRRQAKDISSSISGSPSSSSSSTSETSLSKSPPSATCPETERKEEKENVFSSSESCSYRGEIVDFEFCKEAERGLLSPDAVYYLDLPPSQAQSRGGYGEELYESLKIQERVYSAYKRFQTLSYWNTIDANQHTSREDLHQVIYQKVLKLLKDIQYNSPLSLSLSSSSSPHPVSPSKRSFSHRRLLWE